MNFPFAAIVGQEQLKIALMLCAIDPSLGGVLIRGEKGTAKSTAARALADILPTIEKVNGCYFNCSPFLPSEPCEACIEPNRVAGRSSVPFVTLPLGATEDRVLGTLDLEKALKGAKRVFQPGLLASAHRGILYVDEVNLLPDHLVDVLLDVAAMGVNSVQREGLSIKHLSKFTLIGTMNLEEGDLRPQFLDRFGLMVEVSAPREKTERAEVVKRRIAFEKNPSTYSAIWENQQNTLREQLDRAQRLVPEVELSDEQIDLISHLCCEFEVTSLRADIVMHKAARALAVLDGRTDVSLNDIRQAAELALPHRRRKKPFEQSGLDRERLDDIIQQSQSPASNEDFENDESNAGSGDQNESNNDFEDELEENAGGQQIFAAASGMSTPKIVIKAQSAQQLAGKRSEIKNAPRGRVIQAVPNENPSSLAIGATLRSAALRSSGNFVVTRQDLHQQIRIGKTANLILFVVDASGSMAAQRRMEVVKGSVLALLTDAYQRRDEVGVIGFRGESANMILSPTRSVELAEQSLKELPTGGRTPLSHALQLAFETLNQSSEQDKAPPLLILLSDGKANVPLVEGNDPWREALQLAGLIAEKGVPGLVLDTESGYLRLGRARQLAQTLGAEYMPLENLSAESLVMTIRGGMRH